MNYLLKIFLFLFFTLSSIGMADAIDSTGIPLVKVDVVASKHPYVLASSSYKLACGKSFRPNHEENCTHTISNKTCAEGYTPIVSYAPYTNEYSSPSLCSIRGYELDTNKEVTVEKGKYELKFDKAFANFVSVGCYDHAVMITYTVYCKPMYDDVA